MAPDPVRMNGGNMNEHPKIEIKNVEDTSLFTEIFIDGHKLPGVRSWKLEQGVGNQLPTLTVDLNALNLSTDVAILKWSQEGMRDIERILFKDEPCFLRFSEKEMRMIAERLGVTYDDLYKCLVALEEDERPSEEGQTS